MYVVREDMFSADSNPHEVGEAFSRLEFFVVQDIFFSETCRFADVILPATPSLEKEGTFVSTEHRIQRLYEAIPPSGGADRTGSSSRNWPAGLGPIGTIAIPPTSCTRLPRCPPCLPGSPTIGWLAIRRCSGR